MTTYGSGPSQSNAVSLHSHNSDSTVTFGQRGYIPRSLPFCTRLKELLCVDLVLLKR